MVHAQDMLGKVQLEETRLSAETPLEKLIHGIPFLEVRSKVSRKDLGWKVVDKYFTDIRRKVDLSNSKNLAVYIENLKFLGIFEVQIDFWFTPISIYKNLENEATNRFKKEIEQESGVMELVKGRITLTSLAKSFLEMCTSREQDRRTNAPPA